MSDTPVPAPRPGLSREQLAAVGRARTHLTEPLASSPAEVDQIIADLISAYDTLAARMAWLAAQHAEAVNS